MLLKVFINNRKFIFQTFEDITRLITTFTHKVSLIETCTLKPICCQGYVGVANPMPLEQLLLRQNTSQKR